MNRDIRLVLAAATAAGTAAARIGQETFGPEMGRIPSREQLDRALKAGHVIGLMLARFTPEELSAFRLGLIAAWETPYLN